MNPWLVMGIIYINIWILISINKTSDAIVFGVFITIPLILGYLAG